MKFVTSSLAILLVPVTLACLLIGQLLPIEAAFNFGLFLSWLTILMAFFLVMYILLLHSAHTKDPESNLAILFIEMRIDYCLSVATRKRWPKVVYKTLQGLIIITLANSGSLITTMFYFFVVLIGSFIGSLILENPEN